MSWRGRFRGAAAGIVIDRFAGEPPELVPHPVALLGRGLTALEERTYRDGRGAGVAHVAIAVAAGAIAGGVLRSTTAATATCVAGRMLGDVALDIARVLDAGDLVAARSALPALVGRDPSALDAGGIARAVVESVAENTVDAVVAPALWAAAFGAPGAVAHKTISTLDSMVGHHSERYERFGWAAARLDDVAAWTPARVTAGLVALVRPAAAFDVWRAVRRDAGAHPSPNAGVAEAAFAAALDLRLGGPLAYGPRREDRPAMGTGRPAAAADIEPAVRLARDCALALAALLASTTLLR